MIEYWITYRDLEHCGSRRWFECLDPPSLPVRLLENEIIPGETWTKPIYIRWHHWLVQQTKLHLVTCTHQELTLDEVWELALQAVKFAQEQCGEAGLDLV